MNRQRKAPVKTILDEELSDEILNLAKIRAEIKNLRTLESISLKKISELRFKIYPREDDK